MQLKVLPLEPWMLRETTLADCLESDRYAPVPVRFNRPGVYAEGEQSWFELGDGRAYAYEFATFLHSLKLLEAARLDTQQVHALRAIVAARLATRGQRELLHSYDDAMMARRVHRNTRKYLMRSLKR